MVWKRVNIECSNIIFFVFVIELGYVCLFELLVVWKRLYIYEVKFNEVCCRMIIEVGFLIVVVVSGWLWNIN